MGHNMLEIGRTTCSTVEELRPGQTAQNTMEITMKEKSMEKGDTYGLTVANTKGPGRRTV